MASNRETSLRRARNVLAVMLMVLPLALFVLFERQARRLDALAATGLSVQATVTRAERGTTFYRYQVGGTEHRWNVKRSEAPFEVGSEFTASYLPADPSLSRPFADRSLAALEAKRNRSFTWKVMLGVFGFLGVFALLAQVELSKFNRGETNRAEVTAADLKRRLGFAGFALVPLVGLITWFHVTDALAKGESVLPALAGLVLAVSVFVGTLVYLTRRGPAEIRGRAARVARWAAPVAVGIALVRLVTLAVGY